MPLIHHSSFVIGLRPHAVLRRRRNCQSTANSQQLTFNRPEPQALLNLHAWHAAGTTEILFYERVDFDFAGKDLFGAGLIEIKDFLG
jgi:hypothetical protein